MNKKTRFPLWLWITIGIILVLGIVGAVIYFNHGFTPTQATIPLPSDLGKCLGGMTTLSVSNANIVGSGERIRIYATAKGSECTQIAFTKDQLNNYLSGYKATQDINLGGIKLLSSSKTFPIDNTGRCFPSLNDANIGKLNLCSTSSCTSKGYSSTIKTVRDWTLNCICIYTGCNGNEGSFSASRSTGDFDALFYINSEQTHITRNQQTASLAGGKAKIEWTGDLQNLDQIYAPQYDARLINSKWQLVQKGTYSNIQSYLSTFQSNLDSHNGCSWTDSDYSCYQKLKTTYENSFSSAVLEKTSEYKNAISSLAYGADTDNNALYVSLKATPFPTFIIDLDAVWVGIVPLVGKPKITSCIPTQDLKSGTNSNAVFSIKNDATVNAEFYGSLNCGAGITGTFPNFQISSGETKQITIQLIPNNPNQPDLSTSCTLSVKDLKSDNSDSCGFSGVVHYDSGITCTAGNLYCDDYMKNIVRCSADGKSKVLDKECTLGCEYSSGSATCKGCVNNGQTCSSDSQCCGNNKCSSGTCQPIPEPTCTSHWYYLWLDGAWCMINLWLVTFKWIFAIVVGFLGGLIGASYVRKFVEIADKKKSMLVSLITFAILGLAFGFIAFLYFWVIVGIVAVLAIVRIFI